MDEPTAVPVAEQAAEAPAFSAAYDRDGLIANIPEGVDADKFSKYLDKTPDVYTSFKNYSNIETMKGKGLPNASWDDSDFAALDEARGVPKDSSGYEFGEDITLDEDSANFIKNFAAEVKMTPAQATKAAELLQTVRQAEAAQAEDRKEQGVHNMIEFLSDQWGHQESQSYQNNHKLVSGVLESIGIKDDSPEAEAIWSGPPQIVQILKEYGDMLDSEVIASFGAGDTTTPTSIQDKLNEMTVAMNKMDVSSREYKEMDAKWNRKWAELQRIS